MTEDVPVRLAALFAPSRAWFSGNHQQQNIFNRQNKRSGIQDALFVMANHGVLVEYTLEPIADRSKIRRSLTRK